MNRVRFILKGGYSFVVTCETAKVPTTVNEMVGYSLDGIKGDRPLYVRINEGPIEESEDENDAAV